MSWIVRVSLAGHQPDLIETAAVMADSDGWAQTPSDMLVGFDDRADADRFALQFLGSVVEPVDPSNWTSNEPATVLLPSGDLTLEVGTAFGHGGHPTTELALAAIRRLGDGAGRTLLDVGCGTGVLSLAAAQQDFVVSGCDIDADAVAISVRNAERNGLSDSVSFVNATPSQLATPGWLMGSSGFDVAVVNTLIGVHETEAHAVTALAAPTATIVITGLQGEEQLERAAAAYGRPVAEVHRCDPWLLALL